MSSLIEVQKRIKLSGLAWEAGTTSIGKYFQNHSFKGLGFAPKGIEPKGGKGRLYTQNFAFGGATPPEVVDWRNVDENNYVSAVRDQLDCGACVAFATCAALESRMKIRMGDSFFFNGDHLSVAQLFFCGKGEDGCDEGWVIGKALQYCRDKGVGNEKEHRFLKNNRVCKELDPVVRVKLWRRHTDLSARKEALIKRGPVIGAMHIFSDFGWYKSGIYRPTTADDIGLHAVTIIGFDDSAGCWIIKNSWGTGWGEGGFARIGYGTGGIDTEFPFYDVDLEIV